MYFWAGTATPTPGQSIGDRIELRVMNWQSDGNMQITTETQASREDYFNATIETAALHFEPNGQWLDYAPEAGGQIWRWNLESGETSALNL
jgi:hypothetical protein